MLDTVSSSPWGLINFSTKKACNTNNCLRVFTIGDCQAKNSIKKEVLLIVKRIFRSKTFFRSKI